MRVVFDISVLGAGFYIPRARTGIFRAIENLSQELVKAHAISVFSTGEKLYSYFQSVDYLQTNDKLQGVPLAKPYVNENIMDLMYKLHKLNYNKHKKRLPVNLLNRVVNSIAFRTIARNIVDHDMLARADVYHSPFHPFPEQVMKLTHLHKVITVYDLVPLLYPQFFRFNEKEIIGRVIKSINEDMWVTCISHTTKNDLCNFLPALDPSRVFVTHLAASPLFYPCHNSMEIDRLKAKLGIPGGPYVLSISTLEPRKNVTQTIKCFSRLAQDNALKDLSLVLVGTKGWAFDPIFKEIAANPKIRDRIIVTGYVDDEYLAPLYSGAMMFVYPSFYEGFGLPPLEAMQCGIPVITSNTSSLPEVVGKAGIMVNPEDADALCQAMLTIYNSTEVRQKMSAASLAQARTFSWQKCAEQTINAYKAAIAN